MSNPGDNANTGANNPPPPPQQNPQNPQQQQQQQQQPPPQAPTPQRTANNNATNDSHMSVDQPTAQNTTRGIGPAKPDIQAINLVSDIKFEPGKTQLPYLTGNAFLREISDRRATNQWNDETTMRQVEKALGDEARVWYDEYATEFENKRPEIRYNFTHNFECFTQAFRERFNCKVETSTTKWATVYRQHVNQSVYQYYDQAKSQVRRYFREARDELSQEVITLRQIQDTARDIRNPLTQAAAEEHVRTIARSVAMQAEEFYFSRAMRDNVLSGLAREDTYAEYVKLKQEGELELPELVKKLNDVDLKARKGKGKTFSTAKGVNMVCIDDNVIIEKTPALDEDTPTEEESEAIIAAVQQVRGRRRGKQDGKSKDEPRGDKPPNNKKCTICNSKGHFKKDCPQWGKITCSYCNKLNHKANVCKKKKKDEADKKTESQPSVGSITTRSETEPLNWNGDF